MFSLKATLSMCKTLVSIPYNFQRLISLNHKLFYQKELSVPTFCNVTAIVPFSIKMRVLDVHEYRDCNKLFVELNSSEETESEPFLIVQEGNSVYIKYSGSLNENLEKKICTIVAPIKANLNINSEFGKIALNNFNSEKIVLASDTGDISVDGFQGKMIDVKTRLGNVTFSGVVQSSLINILILEKGSVFTNKLLGEQSRIETRSGNISVNSSYCNRSMFITEEGDMDLKNIHKLCEVNCLQRGNIKITCLDGQLNLTQASGKADIHLSRIIENSAINLSTGQLLLRLSEECQENIRFNINSKNINIDKNVKIEQIHSNDTVSYSETNSRKKVVFLNCKDCSLDIESASWFDMNSLKSVN